MPGACELVAMGMQAVASVAPTQPWVALQVDVRNAFNTASRDAMLRQCAKKVPSCFNWLRWCYAGPSPLVCGGKVVASSHTGVHQGDAMGPLGFSLALEEALDQCTPAGSQVSWEAWYLDDGLIVGSAQSVAHYASLLGPALRSVGLVLNQGKCTLWGPGAMGADDSGPHFPVCVLPNHPLHEVPIIPFDVSHGITVLGTPVSSSPAGEWVHGEWSKVCATAEVLLSRIRKVPEGHLQLTLLRSCADACRVNHLLRSTSFEAGTLAAAGLGESIRALLEEVVGMSVPAGAWAQACLPIWDGGLGIRDPLSCRPAARIAALVSFAIHAPSRVGVPDWCVRQVSPDSPIVIAALANTLGHSHEPTGQWLVSPQALLSADHSFTNQSWWADSLASAAKFGLAEAGGIRDRVRLVAQAGELANSWVLLPPGSDIIPDSDFRSMVRLWLGLPLLPCGDQVARCPACGEALDPFGDHLLSCHKNGITHRHNLLRDAWAEVLGRAGIPHAREVMIPAGLGRSSTFARERPADILLIGWDRGRDVAIDFTVCHPTTMCAFPLSEEKARRHLAQEEHGKTSRQGHSVWRRHGVSTLPPTTLGVPSPSCSR